MSPKAKVSNFCVSPFLAAEDPLSMTRLALLDHEHLSLLADSRPRLPTKKWDRGERWVKVPGENRLQVGQSSW